MSDIHNYLINPETLYYTMLTILTILPDITKIRLMISTGIKPVDIRKDRKDGKYGLVQNS